jgi:hypothetical protein
MSFNMNLSMPFMMSASGNLSGAMSGAGGGVSPLTSLLGLLGAGGGSAPASSDTETQLLRALLGRAAGAPGAGLPRVAGSEADLETRIANLNAKLDELAKMNQQLAQGSGGLLELFKGLEKSVKEIRNLPSIRNQLPQE